MNRLKQEFDKLFTRKSLNPKDKGKYRDDWFIKDGIVSKILFNWINQNYISKEKILGLEELKEEKIEEVKSGSVYEYSDEMWKSRQEGRNELRKEIKQQIIDYKNK